MKLKQEREAAITTTQTGVQRLQEGKLDEAIERFNAALKLDPKYAPAHFHLGTALKKKGQAAAALEAWRKAEQLDPKLKAPVK